MTMKSNSVEFPIAKNVWKMSFKLRYEIQYHLIQQTERIILYINSNSLYFNGFNNCTEFNTCNANIWSACGRWTQYNVIWLSSTSTAKFEYPLKISFPRISTMPMKCNEKKSPKLNWTGSQSSQIWENLQRITELEDSIHFLMFIEPSPATEVNYNDNW